MTRQPKKRTMSFGESLAFLVFIGGVALSGVVYWLFGEEDDEKESRRDR